MTPQLADQTELASNFTVADYKTARSTQDRATIAEALHRRFTERYIDPVTPAPGKEMHGFTIMAISCLMIESLESFVQGWENSSSKSEAAFCYFFDSRPQFSIFRGHFARFYKNVRCGILHQAETTGGWKITRKKNAPLFDAAPASLTINATLFLENLVAVLDGFRDNLKIVEWNSTEWKNVRKKMKALCDNCQP
ncbi:MAG TPA: hypothetical protein VGG19_17700 [Tepidisphaeraceae bacterium]